MRITVIGAGYVGLTTGAALAQLGYTVTLVDKDSVKIEALARGESPIHEPHLTELLKKVAPRMRFSGEAAGSVSDADVILIAVGTPPKANGEADTQHVEDAAREIAEGLLAGRSYTLVVKSTVPIGTNRRVAYVVERVLAKRGVQAHVHYASNPEFLREGMALWDTLYPDRIVIGSDSAEATETLYRLYRPILEQTFDPPSFVPQPEGYRLPPLITVDPTSAEIIKYAANAFLAVKISFINEIAGLCEKVGANVTEVARGMGSDVRIGPRFLNAGLGWGGSCFPKDTSALIAVGADYGYSMPIVQAAREVNRRQRQMVVDKLQSALKVLRGRTVGILGLAFKPDTDDIRESPALGLIAVLNERGVHVRVHDPVASDNARKILSDVADVEFVTDPYEVARNADAIALATEWDMYRRLDLTRLAGLMKNRVLVDGRNLYSREQAKEAGFLYMGVGV